MNVEPPAPEEFDALLRLLDDETPVVRARVAERLSSCGGDLSEWLATHPRRLTNEEKKILSGILASSRREILAREWVFPTGGAAALGEDWDCFEALLRALSDFLHDGITLRQPLSDALDFLAEEAAGEGVATENDLRAFLFGSGRLRGNKSEYYDPRNSDLAWCIDEGKSNPLGLCVIFILVGRRLGLEVEGVNFPGHFLCRIFQDGFPVIIDCFDKGRLHLQSTLLESGSDLSTGQKEQLRRTADPGTILLRLLNNLGKSLMETGRPEDAGLIGELRRMTG